MMKAFILLILAKTLSAITFLPLLLIQTYRRRNEDLGSFYMNCAINEDYTWGSMVLGTDGHTLCAGLYEKSLKRKEIKIYIYILDWMFGKNHCKSAYLKEYNINKTGV